MRAALMLMLFLAAKVIIGAFVIERRRTHVHKPDLHKE